MVARLLRGRVCLGGFGAKFVLVVFLIVSAVFGQGLYHTMPQFDSPGVRGWAGSATSPNLSSPRLDGLLCEHIFYGRDSLRIQRAVAVQNSFFSPRYGRIGTTGRFFLQRGLNATFRNVSGGNLSGGSFFQNVFLDGSAGTSTITLNPNANVLAGQTTTLSTFLTYGGAMPTGVIYGTHTNSSLVNASVGTANVYGGTNVPRFPDVSNFNFNPNNITLGADNVVVFSSSARAAMTSTSRDGLSNAGAANSATNLFMPGRYASINVANNTNVHLQAGTYFIDGDIVIDGSTGRVNGTSLRLHPNPTAPAEERFRTVIYVGGNVTLMQINAFNQLGSQFGAIFAPEGTLPTNLNAPTGQMSYLALSGNASAAQNQVLIIMTGPRSDNNNRGPIVSLGTHGGMVANIINPNGEIIHNDGTGLPTNIGSSGEGASTSLFYLYGLAAARYLNVRSFDYRPYDLVGFVPTPPSFSLGSISFLEYRNDIMSQNNPVLIPANDEIEISESPSRTMRIFVELANAPDEGFKVEMDFEVSVLPAGVSVVNPERTFFTFASGGTLDSIDIIITDSRCYANDRELLIHLVGAPRALTNAGVSTNIFSVSPPADAHRTLTVKVTNPYSQIAAAWDMGTWAADNNGNVNLPERNPTITERPQPSGSGSDWMLPVSLNITGVPAGYSARISYRINTTPGAQIHQGNNPVLSPEDRRRYHAWISGGHNVEANMFSRTVEALPTGGNVHLFDLNIIDNDVHNINKIFTLEITGVVFFRRDGNTEVLHPCPVGLPTLRTITIDDDDPVSVAWRATTFDEGNPATHVVPVQLFVATRPNNGGILARFRINATGGNLKVAGNPFAVDAVHETDRHAWFSQVAGDMPPAVFDNLEVNVDFRDIHIPPEFIRPVDGGGFSVDLFNLGIIDNHTHDVDKTFRVEIYSILATDDVNWRVAQNAIEELSGQVFTILDNDPVVTTVALGSPLGFTIPETLEQNVGIQVAGSGRHHSVPIQVTFNNILTDFAGWTINANYTIEPTGANINVSLGNSAALTAGLHAWVSGSMTGTVPITPITHGAQTHTLFNLNIIDDAFFAAGKTFRVDVAFTATPPNGATFDWNLSLSGNNIFTILDDDPRFIIQPPTTEGSATEIVATTVNPQPSGSIGGVWVDPRMIFAIMHNRANPVPPSTADISGLSMNITTILPGSNLFRAVAVESYPGQFRVEIGDNYSVLDYEEEEHTKAAISLTASVIGTPTGELAPVNVSALFNLLPHNDNQAVFTITNIAQNVHGLLIVGEGESRPIDINATPFSHTDADLPPERNRVLVKGFAPWGGGTPPTNTSSALATLTTENGAELSLGNGSIFNYNHEPAMPSVALDRFFVLVRDTADYAGYKGLPTGHQSGYFDFWIRVAVQPEPRDNFPLEPNDGWASGLPRIDVALFENEQLTIDMNRWFRDRDALNGYGGWGVLKEDNVYSVRSAIGAAVTVGYLTRQYTTPVNYAQTITYNLGNLGVATEALVDTIFFTLRGTRGNLTVEDIPVDFRDMVVFHPKVSFTPEARADSIDITHSIIVSIRPINDIQANAVNRTFDIDQGGTIGTFVGNVWTPTTGEAFISWLPAAAHDLHGTNLYTIGEIDNGLQISVSGVVGGIVYRTSGTDSVRIARTAEETGFIAISGQNVVHNRFGFRSSGNPGIFTFPYSITDNFIPYLPVIREASRRFWWDIDNNGRYLHTLTGPDGILILEERTQQGEVSPGQAFLQFANNSFTSAPATVTIRVRAANTSSPAISAEDVAFLLENRDVSIPLNISDPDFAKNYILGNPGWRGDGELALRDEEGRPANRLLERLTVEITANGNSGTAFLVASGDSTSAANGVVTLYGNTDDIAGSISLDYRHGWFNGERNVRHENPFNDRIIVRVTDRAGHYVEHTVRINQIVPVNDNDPVARPDSITVYIGVGGSNPTRLGINPISQFPGLVGIPADDERLRAGGEIRWFEYDYDPDEWTNTAGSRSAVNLVAGQAPFNAPHRSTSGLEGLVIEQVGNEIFFTAPRGTLPQINGWIEYEITDFQASPPSGIIRDQDGNHYINSDGTTTFATGRTSRARIYVNIGLDPRIDNYPVVGIVSMTAYEGNIGNVLATSNIAVVERSVNNLNNLLSGIGRTSVSGLAADRVVIATIPNPAVAEIWGFRIVNNEPAGTIARLSVGDTIDGRFEYRHLGREENSTATDFVAQRSFSYRGVISAARAGTPQNIVSENAVNVIPTIIPRNDSRPNNTTNGVLNTTQRVEGLVEHPIGASWDISVNTVSITTDMTDPDDWGTAPFNMQTHFKVTGLLTSGNHPTAVIVDSIVMKKGTNVWVEATGDQTNDSIRVTINGGNFNQVVVRHIAEMGNISGMTKDIDFRAIVIDSTTINGAPGGEVAPVVPWYYTDAQVAALVQGYHRHHQIAVPVRATVRNINNHAPVLNWQDLSRQRDTIVVFAVEERDDGTQFNLAADRQSTTGSSFNLSGALVRTSIFENMDPDGDDIILSPTLGAVVMTSGAYDVGNVEHPLFEVVNGQFVVRSGTEAWSGSVAYTIHDGLTPEHNVAGVVYVIVLSASDYMPTAISGRFLNVNEGGIVREFANRGTPSGTFLSGAENTLQYFVRAAILAEGTNAKTPDRARITSLPSRGRLEVSANGTDWTEVIVANNTFPITHYIRYVHNDGAGYEEMEQNAWFSDNFRFVALLPAENTGNQGDGGVYNSSNDAVVNIVVNPRNNNAPELTPKTGNIREGRGDTEFRVIDATDIDFDYGTRLRILPGSVGNIRFENYIGNSSDVVIGTVGDSTIQVRFDGEVRQNSNARILIDFTVIDPAYRNGWYSAVDAEGNPTNDDAGGGDLGAKNTIHRVLNTLTLSIVPQNNHAPVKPAADTLWITFGQNGIIPVVSGTEAHPAGNPEGIRGPWAPLSDVGATMIAFAITDADGDEQFLTLQPGLDVSGNVWTGDQFDYQYDLQNNRIMVFVPATPFELTQLISFNVDGEETVLLSEKFEITYRVRDRNYPGTGDGLCEVWGGCDPASVEANQHEIEGTLVVIVIDHAIPDISVIDLDAKKEWVINQGAFSDLFKYNDTWISASSATGSTQKSILEFDELKNVDRMFFTTLPAHGSFYSRLASYPEGDANADVVIATEWTRITQAHITNRTTFSGELRYLHNGVSMEPHRDSIRFNVMTTRRHGSHTSEENGTIRVTNIRPRNATRPTLTNTSIGFGEDEFNQGVVRSVRTLTDGEISSDRDYANTVRVPAESGIFEADGITQMPIFFSTRQRGNPTLYGDGTNGVIQVALTADNRGITYIYNGVLFGATHFLDTVLIQVMDTTNYSYPNAVAANASAGSEANAIRDGVDFLAANDPSLNGRGNRNFVGYTWDTLFVRVSAHNNRGPIIDDTKIDVDFKEDFCGGDPINCEEDKYTIWARMRVHYVEENSWIIADGSGEPNYSSEFWYGGARSIYNRIPLVLEDSTLQIIWKDGIVDGNIENILDDNGDRLSFSVARSSQHNLQAGFGLTTQFLDGNGNAILDENDEPTFRQDGSFVYRLNPNISVGREVFVDTAVILIRDVNHLTRLATRVYIPIRIVPRKDEATNVAEKTIRVAEDATAPGFNFIGLISTADRYPVIEGSAFEAFLASGACTPTDYAMAQTLISFAPNADMRDFDRVKIALVGFGAEPTIGANSMAWFDAQVPNNAGLEGFDANGEVNRIATITGDSTFVYRSIRVQDSRRPIRRDTVWVAVKSTNWFDCNDSRITLAPIFVVIDGVSPRAQNHEMLVNEGDQRAMWLQLLDRRDNPNSRVLHSYLSIKGDTLPRSTSPNTFTGEGTNLFVLEGTQWGNVDVKIYRGERENRLGDMHEYPRHGTVELRRIDGNALVAVDEATDPWSVDGRILYAHDATRSDWRTIRPVADFDPMNPQFEQDFRDTVWYVIRDREDHTLMDTAFVVVHIKPAPDAVDNAFYSDLTRVILNSAGDTVSVAPGADGVIDMVTLRFVNLVHLEADETLNDLFEFVITRTVAIDDGLAEVNVNIDTPNIVFGDGDRYGREVLIPVLDMPANTTSGFMTLRLAYRKFPLPNDDPEAPVAFHTEIINVEDGTAPVVTQVNFYKSALSEVSDMLHVYLSEGAWAEFENGGHPFIVYKTVASAAAGREEFEVIRVRLVDTTNISGRTRVIMEVVSGDIAPGDSLFINATGTGQFLRDVSGNWQSDENNIRREIRVEYVNSIIGAWYLDIGSLRNNEMTTRRDGFVDIIRVQTAAEMDDKTILAQLLARLNDLADVSFTLPTGAANRNFEVLDIVPARWTQGQQVFDPLSSQPQHFGFDIIVNDNSPTLNTAADSARGDVIRLTQRVHSTIDPLFSLEPLGSTLRIRDSIAPVVVGAVLNIGNNDTTLTVTFSEAIQPHDNRKVFDFFDSHIAGGAVFNIATLAPTPAPQGGGLVWNYHVISMDKAFPTNEEDSIRIAVPGLVRDVRGNFQADTTVWAPLRVNIDQRVNLGDGFKVYPSPARLINRDGRLQPRPITRGVVNRYDINNTRFPGIVGAGGEPRGVAFIFEPSVPLDQDITKHSTRVRIFDQIGNAVSDELVMQFMILNGAITGVAVWDVHNQAGRVVAPKAYVAIVEINLVREDGTSLRETIRTTVNISQSEMR
jgi:hypothetical protein